MSNIYENKGAFGATIVVAASDSLKNRSANYVCDGVNDEVEIQAAIDALPAGGGRVQLLDGTFYCPASIVLDDGVELIGCGYSTVIFVPNNTDTDYPVIAATSKNNIAIRDLRLDGNRANQTGDWPDNSGIKFDTVTYSQVTNCWIVDFDGRGIHLDGSNNISILGNIIRNTGRPGVHCDATVNDSVFGGNQVFGCQCGICLTTSDRCSVVNNLCADNDYRGIRFATCDFITVAGNVCSGNDRQGIELFNTSRWCVVDGNVCRENGQHGINIDGSDDCVISNNLCTENSQDTDNTYDNISIDDGERNLIANNTCRQGALGNDPKYGINISNAGCIKCVVQGNDLYDSGQTGHFNDAGTSTIVQDDNRELDDPSQVKHMVYAQNTSAGNLTTGNVVAYEAAAGAVGFHSPTAVGDPMVWGMLAEDININAFGYIQTLGGTVLLDATNVAGGAIAIGDLLCTEVGSRARKAAAGHMVFAIAMEVCNGADCVINALLITPRQM